MLVKIARVRTSVCGNIEKSVGGGGSDYVRRSSLLCRNSQSPASVHSDVKWPFRVSSWGGIPQGQHGRPPPSTHQRRQSARTCPVPDGSSNGCEHVSCSRAGSETLVLKPPSPEGDSALGVCPSP